jgi:hypothetical protein
MLSTYGQPSSICPRDFPSSKEVTMRGFLFWFGDAFAHAMGALGWEDKKTVPPPIGLQPYTGFRDKRGHGY